jgi:hypothetical protein
LSHVVRVQGDMQAHAQGHRQQSSLAQSKPKGDEQGGGSVQRSRRRMTRRIRLIEETHRRREIKTPPPQAEPGIVVGVDKHATRPEA